MEDSHARIMGLKDKLLGEILHERTIEDMRMEDIAIVLGLLMQGCITLLPAWKQEGMRDSICSIIMTTETEPLDEKGERSSEAFKAVAKALMP